MSEPASHERLNAIVLASASPRRAALLESLGLKVRVVPSRYPEPPLGLAPVEAARVHAREKLRDVALRLPDAVVLAADTVVDVDGVALGKPRDELQAAAMLRCLAGREHLVHTAVAIHVPARPGADEFARSTRVRFYPLDEAAIAEYLAAGQSLDKAGAYGIQGRAAALVEGIVGDFYTVMGLPLGGVIRALARLGFSLPEPNPNHLSPHR